MAGLAPTPPRLPHPCTERRLPRPPPRCGTDGRGGGCDDFPAARPAFPGFRPTRHGRRLDEVNESSARGGRHTLGMWAFGYIASKPPPDLIPLATAR